MRRTIVLLGPPGSGKGTQAERLREERGFVPLSTGDLLREARASGTELGERVAERMDRGELVPDAEIVEVIRDAISGLDDQPVLLDGFPRTVEQAAALDDVLEGAGRELTDAIFVDVPDDVVAERISARHQGREDDAPETVRNRLRVYHRRTEPLIDYYESRGLLRRVDGADDPDTVAEGVRSALEDHQS